MVSCVTYMEQMGFDINTGGVHVSVGRVQGFSFGLGSGREYGRFENIDQDEGGVCLSK